MSSGSTANASSFAHSATLIFMPSLPPSRPATRLTALALPLLLVCGCARPGPPHAPSLRIPAVVTDLSASRTGDVVYLRFTAPTRASDGIPLPAGALRGVLCRQLVATPPGTPGPCVSVTGIDITIAAKSSPQAVHLEDTLPAPLTTSAPHLLSYRVQFFSPAGRTIGDSEPAYSVAGAAPVPVTGFTATGARNGILLNWNPSDPGEGEVLLERTDLAQSSAAQSSSTPRKPQPATRPAVAVTHHSTRHPVATPERTSANITWLQANADPGTGRTLDTSIESDTPYRYRALRRTMVHLGGRTIELRSALSSPQELTLQQVYPPAAPVGLSVAAYFERFGAAQTNELTPTFAVDLVWQPVDDDTRTAALAGYNIYRETLDSKGQITTPATRLNPTPVLLPAFRDAAAKPTDRYRYRVTAIDTRGNESPAATTTLEPQPKQ